MPNSGQLRRRLRFEAHSANEDGDRTGPGVDRLFMARAADSWLPGTEAIEAARLEGKQPVAFVMHSTRATRALTTDCWAVDTNDETQVYDIKSIEPMDVRNQWIKVTAVKRGGGTVG